LQRGRNNEALTIENEKLTKNNKTYTVEDSKTGKFTNVKPDANDPHQISEIKDVKKLSNTSQIRAERQLAKDQGKDFKIYTGTDTKVSKTIPPCELITRDYLGPQNTLSNPVLE
jgi:hypothetical protein